MVTSLLAQEAINEPNDVDSSWITGRPINRHNLARSIRHAGAPAPFVQRITIHADCYQRVHIAI